MNYKQGYYQPQNPEKYIKSRKSLNHYLKENSEFPFYRSSYELSFFKFCDLNPKISKWSSEPFPIRYLNPLDNKVHNYFIDFVIKIDDQTYLVEIKPYLKTQKPKRKNKYEIEEYQKNVAKWKACKSFCDRNGFKFLIITEKNLPKMI